MKRYLIISTALIGLVFCFSSCVALHSALSSNVNTNTTEVVLAKNNYTIVDRIEGTASTVSVFGIGNHGFKTLVANARAHMLDKAKFIGTSRAVINENIEINNRQILIVGIKSVHVSAYLIEFTE
jgi:hypothetical protein